MINPENRTIAKKSNYVTLNYIPRHFYVLYLKEQSYFHQTLDDKIFHIY